MGDACYHFWRISEFCGKATVLFNLTVFSGYATVLSNVTVQ